MLDGLFNGVADLVAQSTAPIMNEDKLQLYGLYKQATKGDCNTDRPAVFDFVGRSKWGAWDSLRGVTAERAKKMYIASAVRADPLITGKMTAYLEGSEGPIEEEGHHQGAGGKFESAAMRMVEQKDYSEQYSHPYFKAIKQGSPLPHIEKAQLLVCNNTPAVYPLHFAIEHERANLVEEFLELLSVADIESMHDEEGTGILEYAELMENDEILELVKARLAKGD